MAHELVIRGVGAIDRDLPLTCYGGGPGDGRTFRAIEAVPHLTLACHHGGRHVYRIRHIKKAGGLTEVGLWYAPNTSGQATLDHGPVPVDPEENAK
jgi:hypothetical protein